jgi:SSS family solute:Na+ symporter
MTGSALATLSGQFTWIDWAVVVGYLALTTYLGAKLAGKQSSIRDFFLGGRKLPWYAVSGSIIATEISALTFVSVPSIVFKPGAEGNFTYLQLGVIGTFIARVIVGYVLVPAYYKREIYSPYDYMGNQLGGHVRTMTSVLFSLGGILGQGARVYLTAEVLMVVLHDQLVGLEQNTGMPALAWAIFFIGAVSVGWTLIGGITTVIWTDVLLFLVFLAGAVVALFTVALNLDGGFGEMFRVGWSAKDSGPWGKFTFFDFSTDPARQYTFWTAVFLASWGGLGAYGTDQLLAQRMFCCKNERDARWAIISSTASQLVTLTVMLVGVGLYAFYRQSPADGVDPSLCDPQYPNLCGEAAGMFRESSDRIFPIFILQKIPTGLRGLIIAGIFAAAISSLMGILTALSQVVMSAFYNPLRERQLRRQGIEVSLSGDFEGMAEDGGGASAEDRRSVLVGRLMVVFWGVVLCLMAYFATYIAEHYHSILDLGLAMVGFTAGALLAGFALAFFPLRIDGAGYMWSGPLSAFCVFAMVWHTDWTPGVCWAMAIVLLAAWVYCLVTGLMPKPTVLPPVARHIAFLAGLALLMLLQYHGYWYAEVDGESVMRTLSWPWYAPVGSVIAFAWGYLLAGRRTTHG